MQRLSDTGLKTGVPAVYTILAIVGTIFLCCDAGFCQADTQEVNEPNVVECLLWYKPGGFDLRLNAERTSLKEKKGPDFIASKVSRGEIRNFQQDTKPMLFVLDTSQQKLYLDLNNNLDLTDDGNAVFSSSRSSRSQFDGMQVKKLVGDVSVPYVINAQIIPSVPYYNFMIKSGFEGNVKLEGKDFRVLLADNMDGVLGQGDYFVIISADSNFRPPAELLENDAPQEVFLDGRGWALSYEFAIAEDRPCVRVKFREITRPTETVRIDGKFIRYAYLRNDRTMIVLENPQQEVTMPVGTYIFRHVYMDACDAGMFQRSNFGVDSIRVEKDQVETLKAGGPLSNTAEIKRVGRVLQLNYRLKGADDKDYVSLVRDDKKAPKFAAYKGDRQIGSGVFKFG